VTPHDDLRSGDVLGDYRLQELIGEGAMGLVYRAVHETLGHPVALKVLRPELSDDTVFRRRFTREAKIASAVEHENLVPIVESGETRGRAYLAAGYVEGLTLEERLLVDGPLPLDDLLEVIAGLGAALGALHRHGLIHRDVKPSNVMLDPNGKALLTDFGLARGPAYTALTRPGQLMGTVEYLAPELIRGEMATKASDIYALGCLAYACATGVTPFGGRGIFEVTVAHLAEAPGDPCAVRPDLPAELSGPLLAALAKEPAERPRSARAYALSLWVSAKRPS
jgi:serine/threonine-protein kinase